ncbi:hypothetical protein CHH65_09055 [Shouchella clausii]|nr:hypothetical protein CHH73_09950 [Shouchella clausii]PAD47825.1 hypothetical protein CHI09_03970 [Shouchella clausii]PAF09789.1 hypothetical protein CHH65_09055 [Shouchella clausii]
MPLILALKRINTYSVPIITFGVLKLKVRAVFVCKLEKQEEGRKDDPDEERRTERLCLCILGVADFYGSMQYER